MQVPRRSGDVDIQAIACIEFRQRRAQRVQTHASARGIKRVRVRSDPEWSPIQMSRTSHASIGGLPRASPSDRATWGWGTTWGGGIKGWGKVTRSGLLALRTSCFLRLNVISRRRPYGPRGAKSFRPTLFDQFGTFRSRSSSQAAALESDGARQSPRGDSEPPDDTFGPFGMAERLNWLKAKKRRRNTSSQRRISGRS